MTDRVYLMTVGELRLILYTLSDNHNLERRTFLMDPFVFAELTF